MQVDVVIENRYARTPDGAVWTPALFGYSFWTRYLDVFSSVRVVARVQDVASVPEDWKRADGPSVSFAQIPSYHGVLQYLRRLPSIHRATRAIADEGEALILRVPSPASHHMFRALSAERPFGVEVVGDPYEVFAPGAFQHPLRPLLRAITPRQTQAQCAVACAVAYVSAHALQPSYPPRPGAFVTEYSSVELPSETIADAPRRHQPQPRLEVVTVGTLEQMYKGFDVLIDAVALCTQQHGIGLSLRVVGDGKHRDDLAERARQKGVAEHITFLGRLPAGEAIRDELDRADLFVLPSRTEGLPRSMIEAMARAVPCIGTRVGGIPQLIGDEDLVPPDDAEALAACMTSVVREPKRMDRMSERALERSRDYEEGILAVRRRAFYRAVAEDTETWLRGASPAGPFPISEA